MSTQEQFHISKNNIVKVTIGVLIFCILGVLLVLPQGLKFESGEDFITIFLIISIGCGFIYYGLKDRK